MKAIPEFCISLNNSLLLLSANDITYFYQDSSGSWCNTLDRQKIPISIHFEELIEMTKLSGFRLFSDHFLVNEKYLEAVCITDGEQKILIRGQNPVYLHLN